MNKHIASKFVNNIYKKFKSFEKFWKFNASVTSIHLGMDILSHFFILSKVVHTINMLDDTPEVKLVSRCKYT